MLFYDCMLHLYSIFYGPYNAVQTPKQHVEKPIVTYKTQFSVTIGNNTHKGTNNSVADALNKFLCLLKSQPMMFLYCKCYSTVYQAINRV